VRRFGGGRRPLSANDPTLLEDLRQILEPITLGVPERVSGSTMAHKA